MRIAISSDGDFVSSHLGRCPFFILFDIENGQTVNREKIENPGHSPETIRQFLHEKGVQCVVCGGIGVQVADYFAELGIEMLMGVSGKIDEVIQKLERRALKRVESSNPVSTINSRKYMVQY